MARWQLFNVSAGWLRRNDRGQFEIALDLRAADSEEVTLNVAFDRSGATWGWQPEEPPFVADFEEEE